MAVHHINTHLLMVRLHQAIIPAALKVMCNAITNQRSGKLELRI